ncbi:MAG: hypothetical protein M1837_007021 [Sclerophora amabilis]|nr:MAG: hypothetical protein M1837_007021 [Sclerophora amabilis]
MGQVFTKKALKRVDWFGATLLLAASLLLVTALEEAGIRYPWRSALVITFLVVSGILWITFVAWEHRVTRAASAQEPVFPWRFFQSRVRIGMILSTFLVGAPFTVAVIQIPQRFQAVNGTTPLGAGVRLLPFAFASPVGSFVSSIIAGKAKVPPIYLILVGAVLQVVGYALLSTISTGSEIQPAQYGYEVITGLGVGVNISTLILMTPFTIEKRDQSVAMGAVVQFRVMGGAIGLAIVTSVMNSFVKSRLAEILSADQIEAFLQSISMIGTLPPALAEMVRSVLGEGYNLQMKVLIGFAAAQIPAILLMWQKKQILV